MEFIYFVGVDVSKGELDFAIYKEKELLFHKETSNNQKAISQFIKELQKLDGFELSKTIFCMEHTGIYNNPLLVFLHKRKGNIWLEAATKIKNSLGNIRGKNDKLDAIRIGCFAYKNRDEIRLWKPKREVVVNLADLTTVRKRLIKAKKQLKTPLKELVGFSKNSSINKQLKICQRTLNSLEADIKKVDKAIMVLIKEDQELSRLFNIVTSVQCIGKETAVQMLITTNEFIDINNPKCFACYSGVAPFSNESGTYKGRSKVSHMANKTMKSLLHMASLSAVQYNADCKAYFERRINQGKNKMSVLNAVRNKLIHRIFKCVKENRKYEKNYMTVLA